MPQSPSPDRAGIVAMPPLIYLAGLAVGLAAHWVYPVPLLPPWPARLLGMAAGLSSIPWVLLALRALSRAGTPLDARKATTALVTDGPYRWSRNPAYLSLTLLYIGLALFIDSVWIAAMLVPVIAVIRWGVIAREEAYLERKFGQAYLDYKARVRRWI